MLSGQAGLRYWGSHMWTTTPISLSSFHPLPVLAIWPKLTSDLPFPASASLVLRSQVGSHGTFHITISS